MANQRKGGFFKNLNIGSKLIIGFGILVLETMVVIGFSYMGGFWATSKIIRTEELHLPTAIASIRARKDLLRILVDVRGYLVLGDKKFLKEYTEHLEEFEENMVELESLSKNFNRKNEERFRNLKKTFEEWTPRPDHMFELRDDQFEREPAYRLTMTDASRAAGHVLIDINTMIEIQGDREPTADNMELLEDMAKFQGGFISMFSGLRGYVTTRNRIYRQEYEVNLVISDNYWQRLMQKQKRLNPTQLTKLTQIMRNRENFSLLPGEIFNLLESDRWREDLYLFKTEIVPRTDMMQSYLKEMAKDHLDLLISELEQGRRELETTNWRTLFSGVLAFILGLGLALFFRGIIAGPVGRLTVVAEKIRAGDPNARAHVESGDEIGVLAEAFNNMTDKLNQTLRQVRKEKKRADDLLEVVIPMGVSLASEKNFKRLLENTLLKAKTFCNAEAGTLYLRPENRDHLEFVIVRNDARDVSLGGIAGKEITLPPLPLYDEKTGEPEDHLMSVHSALTGETVNIEEIDESKRFTYIGIKIDEIDPPYKASSYLTIPLKSSRDEVIGVLQLLNARDSETGDYIPFDPSLQRMMESFSSLAAAALENYIREQTLKREIKKLRIKIDQTKRRKLVEEITDSDSFRDLQAKAEEMRRRRKRKRKKKPR